MSGYRRFTVQGLGIGAAEIWAATTTDLADGQPTTVGTVFQTFDRTAYLQIAESFGNSLEIPGPRLVLLADTSVTGPLAMRLETDSPHGLPTDTITESMPCRLRGRSGEYVLGVGPAIEVAFDQATIDAGLADDPSRFSRDAPASGGSVDAAAREALEWLVDSDFEDGLGWLPTLHAHVRDSGPAGDVGTVARAWVDAMTEGGDAVVPEDAVAILGRGPGATPSGDDITAGICVTLAATVDAETRQRVMTVGDAVIAAALERTTTVSTALLAQATRGRAADPVLEALEGLLTPTPDRVRREAFQRLTDVGHSSGIDMAVGMLLTLLVIRPAIEETSR